MSLNVVDGSVWWSDSPCNLGYRRGPKSPNPPSLVQGIRLFIGMVTLVDTSIPGVNASFRRLPHFFSELYVKRQKFYCSEH